jgi:hypothetical protein
MHWAGVLDQIVLKRFADHPIIFVKAGYWVVARNLFWVERTIELRGALRISIVLFSSGKSAKS